MRMRSTIILATAFDSSSKLSYPLRVSGLEEAMGHAERTLMTMIMAEVRARGGSETTGEGRSSRESLLRHNRSTALPHAALHGTCLRLG